MDGRVSGSTAPSAVPSIAARTGNNPKGDRDGALSAYQKVLEIDPQNAGARQSVEMLGKALQGNPI